MHTWVNRLHRWGTIQKIYLHLHVALFILSLQEVFIINPPFLGFPTPAIREHFCKLFDLTLVWKVFSQHSDSIIKVFFLGKGYFFIPRVPLPQSVAHSQSSTDMPDFLKSRGFLNNIIIMSPTVILGTLFLLCAVHPFHYGTRDK